MEKTDLEHLLVGLDIAFDQPWQVVDHFEKTIADFFGAPYAVATDSCTHALELCLRAANIQGPLVIPRHTYMSVPMMLDKLGISYHLEQIIWSGWYEVVTDQILDAATLWERDSYVPGTAMCVSFQFKKHINLGRGGMILLDHEATYHRLQRLVRDGRDRSLTQWEDDIIEPGFHYHMTPEQCALGIRLFSEKKDIPARRWGNEDYRDLLELSYFRNRHRC